MNSFEVVKPHTGHTITHFRMIYSREFSFYEPNHRSILRELYEGLREYCEAIAYLRGYKFIDHESIGFFIKDVLNEEIIYRKFDRYRKLRNGINY